MDPIPFPNHNDAPQRVLLFSADQVVVFSAFFLLGMLTDFFFTFLIIGFVVAKLFTRYRDSQPDGFLVHAAYWYGIPGAMKGRNVLNPFLRRILPA